MFDCVWFLYTCVYKYTFVCVPSVQDWGADLWWNGRAGAGGLWGDNDLCSVTVCSLPHCLCQQYWLALHNPLHQARWFTFQSLCFCFVSVLLNPQIAHTRYPSRHRSEEQCLVRSGLVQLMDSLCSLSGQRECSSNEKQTKKQKVATMAWAAFQVLANRCIEWEKVEGKLCLDQWVHIKKPFFFFTATRNDCTLQRY